MLETTQLLYAARLILARFWDVSLRGNVTVEQVSATPRGAGFVENVDYNLTVIFREEGSAASAIGLTFATLTKLRDGSATVDNISCTPPRVFAVAIEIFFSKLLTYEFLSFRLIFPLLSVVLFRFPSQFSEQYQKYTVSTEYGFPLYSVFNFWSWRQQRTLVVATIDNISRTLPRLRVFAMTLVLILRENGRVGRKSD